MMIVEALGLPKGLEREMGQNGSWRGGSVGRGLPILSASCKSSTGAGVREIPALGRGRQGDQAFKAILGYVVR